MHLCVLLDTVFHTIYCVYYLYVTCRLLQKWAERRYGKLPIHLHTSDKLINIRVFLSKKLF